MYANTYLQSLLTSMQLRMIHIHCCFVNAPYFNPPRPAYMDVDKQGAEAFGARTGTEHRVKQPGSERLRCFS